MVFRPVVGLTLKGKVNKVLIIFIIIQISDQHIGLLVHGLFNASISHDILPSTYSYDEDSRCWFNSETSGAIKIGTDITFIVDKINDANGMINISAKPI